VNGLTQRQQMSCTGLDFLAAHKYHFMLQAKLTFEVAESVVINRVVCVFGRDQACLQTTFQLVQLLLKTLQVLHISGGIGGIDPLQFSSDGSGNSAAVMSIQ